MASVPGILVERGLGFRLGLGLVPADFREALGRIERELAPGAVTGTATASAA